MLSPPPPKTVSNEAAELELRAALEVDVETHLLEESRSNARLVVPFLFPTIGLVGVIAGHATDAFAVRMAFGACVVLVLVRLLLLKSAAHRDSWLQASRWRAAILTASSWSTSGAMAAIYLTLGPAVTVEQWLTLALVSTAVCAVALLTAASSLLTYVGYVTIQLVTLAFCLHSASGQMLVPGLAVFFIAALTLIARKNNASVREKLLLTLKVRDFGLRDSLTGLRNRAFAEELADHRAQQIVDWSAAADRRRKVPSGKRLALLLVDLDHFKRVNDVHGHAAGDLVLASFAKTAQSVVRAGDVVARWGGEEFLVVLEVDEREAAHEVAERIRKAIAGAPVALGNGRTIEVTCSIGATLFPVDPARPSELTWRETLELADASLYRAKALGRNQTAWSGGFDDADDVPTVVYGNSGTRKRVLPPPRASLTLVTK